MEARELLELLERQEDLLRFDSFTDEDARRLGNILADIAAENPAPTTVRVTIGDTVVFQYTDSPEADVRLGWVTRKYNLIRKTGHSSMHACVRNRKLGELADKAAQEDVYGFGCGGFPIRLKDEPITEENKISSIIGCAALSGLPDPQDHDLVVRALEQYLGVEAPKTPDQI